MTKEEKKEYDRKYYLKNKEKIIKHHRDNKAIIKKQRQKSSKENANHLRELGRIYKRQPKHRYKFSIRLAKNRNYDYNLSFDEYCQMIKMPCHYCGEKLNETGSGLDRKNNEPYYEISNVVPCCRQCNTCFMHFFSYEEKLMLGATVKKINSLRKESGL